VEVDFETKKTQISKTIVVLSNTFWSEILTQLGSL